MENMYKNELQKIYLQNRKNYSKIMKYYTYNNLAGCVKQWINRNKQKVGIYNSVQQGIDSDYKWCVVCEKHGTFLSCGTLNLAFQTATNTKNFCEECREHE